MPPVRTLIADDHQLFAETLGLTLDFDERVEVVGSAANGKEAVRLALELQPDSVLMDLEMPLLDGVGAAAYLTKGRSIEHVVEALLESAALQSAPTCTHFV